jgi:hyperosmotically inducible periplasmic protein
LKRRVLCLFVLGIALAGPACTATGLQSGAERSIQPSFPPVSPEHLAREIRRELVTLPSYSVFDNLDFTVTGRTVTLTGQVTKPALKSDAETAVKGVAGVESVANKIQVLAPLPLDERIRMAEYHAIYREPGLDRYAVQAIPPIHIVVNSGNVTLDGVVDSQSDKELATTRANSVSGVFSVTNNLQVESKESGSGIGDQGRPDR